MNEQTEIRNWQEEIGNLKLGKIEIGNRKSKIKHPLNMNPHNSKAGFVLYVALLTILTAGAVGGFFLYAASNHSQAARRWHDADQCLLDAQSGLEQIKYELVQCYLSNQASGASSLGWFQTWGVRTIGSNPVYNLSVLPQINGSIVTVTLANVTIMTNANYVDVVLIGAASRTATFPITRKISETLRIPSGSNSTIFDYVYFINNSGTLDSKKMSINGDARANGNFTFSASPHPQVNGKVDASGTISGKPHLSDNQHQYWQNAPDQARPTNPTDGSSANAWPMGYDADHDVTDNENVPALAMPVIGDITQLAATASGTLSQNGANIVVNVYNGAGPDGVTGTADDNCLVLDGSAKPVTISGAVVVKGDLVIKGQISGQGTIYAGRNIHIVGDLAYVSPPSWPKDKNNGDSNPTQTAANNQNKDLLVLAAKGNIIVGNYTSSTWSNQVYSIMTDPANITPFNVDPSDAALGYDSDTNAANGYLFNGRYYLNEANNGRRLSGAGTNTVPRKFYESSLSYATFNSLCEVYVPSINAALISQHGIIGDWGKSGIPTTLNGSMACHDDLNNMYGTLFNWDIRLGSSSKETVNTHFLPVSGGATTPITIGWKETH